MSNNNYEQDLGEGMALVLENINGWMKPRYLIDKNAGTAVEFMDELETLCTVTLEDIDWKSLESLDSSCIRRAKSLDAHFPTRVCMFHNGVSEVSWQLNPDGRYYMDDDGFGMTNDQEVEIYGFIDRQGKVVSKFRHINEDWELLKTMRTEAEKMAASK